MSAEDLVVTIESVRRINRRLGGEVNELRAKIVELTTALESERQLVAELAEEGQGLAAERDALRKRLAELEQPSSDYGWHEDTCDVTEPPPRIRARSIPEGRMREGQVQP